MIGVAVLGSTGSVGASTLDVLARHPQRFRLVALAANTNAPKLARQIEAFRPQYAALADPQALMQLRERLGTSAPGTRLLAGAGALEEIARAPEVNCVMAAIVGAAGLPSTLAAARAGKRLLLANKESLVMAGPLLIAAVRASGATLLPIDSEHNAIFQCLPPRTVPGTAPAGLRRVLLTASGGPFRDLPREALTAVTPEARTAATSSGPAMTSDSLLASSSRLPAPAAASVERRPAAPTIAAITQVTSGSIANSSRASGPARRRVPPALLPSSSRRSLAAAGEASAA